MNYYIQGNAANADKIKAAFEKLGIVSNADRYNYKNDNVLYFTAGGMIHMIDAYSSWANIIKTHPDYKELELPVEPKFKVGDKVLDNMMIVTVRDVVYDQNYKEYKYGIGSYWVFESALKPYKPHYDIANFHAGMPVLVRDANDKEWRYVLYSHSTGRYGLMRFNAGATIWNQCIPFNEDTKHLLGTTDMPSEEYINW